MKGLRPVGAKDLATANAYLQQVFVPLWNRRFRRQPQRAGDAHRALLPETNLDSVPILVLLKMGDSSGLGAAEGDGARHQVRGNGGAIYGSSGWKVLAAEGSEVFR